MLLRQASEFHGRQCGQALPDLQSGRARFAIDEHRRPIGHETPPLLRALRYRLLNWKLRRALALPYFFRSTTRESRVRKPAAFRIARRSGS